MQSTIQTKIIKLCIKKLGVFIAYAYSIINSKGDIGIYFVSNKTLSNLNVL